MLPATQDGSNLLALNQEKPGDISMVGLRFLNNKKDDLNLQSLDEGDNKTVLAMLMNLKQADVP